MKMLFLSLAILGVAFLAFMLVEAHLANKRRLASAGVRDVKKLVEPLMKPTVLIGLAEAPGTSYFGGHPPAHEGFVWPVREGRPLGFLACIDLAETSGSLDWLPQRGWLLFFYDLEGQAWGFDPKDRGAAVVLWVANPPAVQTEFPFPSQGWKTDWEIDRHPISFKTVKLPPSSDAPVLDRLRLSDSEQEQIDEWRSSLRASKTQHQLGGDPSPVQDAAMALECQLVTNGLYCGDASGYEDPRAEKLKAGAKDWALLLQIDTDDDLKLMWGDAGMVYFWVKTEEARKGDFSNAWLIQQCY